MPAGKDCRKNSSRESSCVSSAETEKLAYYVLWNGRNEVTAEDIKNVSIAEIASDTFALANSVADGRYDDAMRALSVMKFRRVEPVMVMSDVSRVISELVAVKAMCEEGLSPQAISSTMKMNEYKVKLYVGNVAGKSMTKLTRALELCSEADLALKLSPQGYTAIEKLICSL